MNKIDPNYDWKKRRRSEQYNIYHCVKCGKFFANYEGTQLDNIRGQQLEVYNIVCKSCEMEKKK